MQNICMQDIKKKIIMQSIAKTVKRLRGDKSQFMLGAEYDIPSSVISDIECAVKNPQLTTLFKLANEFGVSVSKFMKELEKDLPKNYSVGDEC